jgi:hypothetical protein
MILTNDNLQAMASGGVVGSSWPYDRGSEEDIEAYLKNVVAELGRSRILEVNAELMHYGSGFASFVHVFCYKRNDKSTVHNVDMDCTDGIAVYLGRLGPVAAYGPEHRTRSYRRGRLGELPPGDWNEEINEIKDKLQRFGFYLPSREELSKELPFPADIPTILGEQPYRVFDAVFYWSD